MASFQLDEGAVRASLSRARERVAAGAATAIAERGRAGGGLEPEEIAALWLDDALGTETLYRLAREVRAAHPRPLETFSPLYVTNTCDAECRMCGMRRDNRALARRTAEPTEVDEQLRLLAARGMRAVAILTGEYRGPARADALRRVNLALRATHRHGFRHVLVNVGSIDDDEVEAVLDGLPRDDDGRLVPNLTSSTFQETYSRACYERYMGTDAGNPRADFDRRLANLDRMRRAGMRGANPGVLLGLDRDLGFELTALATHARHLLSEGMEVYLSVPRLRRIAGGGTPVGVSDDAFVRIVSALSLGLPEGKVVITTRESRAMQVRLVPIVSVLSAGSAAVTPYTASGARFPLEESQFEVVDQRPFEDILAEHGRPGEPIVNWEPASSAAGAAGAIAGP
jgi:2-iminoacetate synthase